ncbi:MAG TPA: LuxR C-terminal-related transcriptional regulator [Fimbriimonadaceae bacterium]|nr:LuxR C-terminal-related transcriptional regulator [Fimbriimonadaceae bacterium]
MKVSVVSGDALLREGLLSILAHQATFRVSGSSDSVASAEASVGDIPIDLMVIDGSSVSSKDWASIKNIRNAGVKVVMISNGAKQEKDNADSVVERSGGAANLFQGLRLALGQGTTSHVREPGAYYGTYPRMLTPREHEVAMMIAQGMPNRRISETIGLREQSVKNLVSTIMRKLDCENRVQVALKLASKS